MPPDYSHRIPPLHDIRTIFTMLYMRYMRLKPTRPMASSALCASRYLSVSGFFGDVAEELALPQFPNRRSLTLQT